MEPIQPRLAARYFLAAVITLGVVPSGLAAQTVYAAKAARSSERARDAGPAGSSKERREPPLQGYYLRVGLGLGGLHNEVAHAYFAESDTEGTANGLGMSMDLTISGPIAAAWTLGGGAWSTLVLASDYASTGGADVADELKRPVSLNLVGLVTGWYFAREFGLHAQLGLGLAVFQTQRAAGLRRDDSIEPTFGPGLSLGLGSELWIDENVGLGALVRITAATALQREEGVVYQHIVFAPALLLTACING